MLFLATVYKGIHIKKLKLPTPYGVLNLEKSIL